MSVLPVCMARSDPNVAYTLCQRIEKRVNKMGDETHVVKMLDLR